MPVDPLQRQRRRSFSTGSLVMDTRRLALWTISASWRELADCGRFHIPEEQTSFSLLTYIILITSCSAATYARSRCEIRTACCYKNSLLLLINRTSYFHFSSYWSHRKKRTTLKDSYSGKSFGSDSIQMKVNSTQDFVVAPLLLFYHKYK